MRKTLLGGIVFVLEDRNGDLACNRDGVPFVYSSRQTARTAARILAKQNRTYYEVVNR